MNLPLSKQVFKAQMANMMFWKGEARFQGVGCLKPLLHGPRARSHFRATRNESISLAVY